MREEALLLGKARSLVGIMTDPPETERNNNLPAIVLLNAGIVHRVGPNRLHVNMARNLAERGFVVLRFDFSGIGDSGVCRDNLPFVKSAVGEVQEAMNYVSAARGIERFLLIGICSGAVISFRTACCDPRVVGAILINARGHLHGNNDESSSYIRNRAIARYYWRMAFFSSFSAKSWLRAIKGKVDYPSILRVIMSSQLRSLFGWKRKVSSGVNHGAADVRLLTERGVSLLHVYAEGDEGLDYLHVILGNNLQEWSASGQLRVEIIQGVNHTFTPLWSQEHLLNIVQNWAQEMVQN